MFKRPGFLSGRGTRFFPGGGFFWFSRRAASIRRENDTGRDHPHAAGSRSPVPDSRNRAGVFSRRRWLPVFQGTTAGAVIPPAGTKTKPGGGVHPSGGTTRTGGGIMSACGCGFLPAVTWRRVLSPPTMTPPLRDDDAAGCRMDNGTRRRCPSSRHTSPVTTMRRCDRREREARNAVPSRHGDQRRRRGAVCPALEGGGYNRHKFIIER